MAMFTQKQAQLFGRTLKALKAASTWAYGKGGKAVGTPKGQYVIKTSAKKIARIFKKEGFANVVKKGPKVVYETSMGAWLKKPRLNAERLYAAHVKKFEFKHGKNPANWPAGVQLESMKEFMTSQTPGVHYKGPMPSFDRAGGYLGQKATRHIFRKVATGGVLAAGAAGFATDKGTLSGHVEGPRGLRAEAFTKTMGVHNPAGAGGHWAAGGAVRGPKGITAAGGWNVGIGHAEKAGIAHQLGGHLNINTPIFKTGIKGETQHAFGLKSRSRRVAAIRRATFGSEQHLGVGKKLNKSARAKDTLYH